jgi:hypothetical protein
MRIRTGQLLNLSIGVPPGEQAVHDFCAANDHGTDLLAVDGFGCGRPGVADKGERSSRLGHPRPTSAKRNCAAARVRPVRRVEARSSKNGPERTADVPCPERGADAGGEHQVVVVPPVPRSHADLVLTIAVEAERICAALR